VTIHGPAAPAGSAPAGQSLSNALAGALAGSGSEAPTPPPARISSLAELRQAVAGIAGYDGLYASLPGHGSRRVYRSRALLITGQTELPFVVG